jgi:hypothetical protein
MDQDPCVGNVGWSVLGGAPADSTLAGVLAGFLIAAAVALLMQWYDRSDPDTIALFASGVPALALSSYLFTVLSGTKPGPNPGAQVCGQIWSQWLPAFAMLLIGASVFLCGLGWALVSYGDNLAVKLIERNRPMKRVEENRRFFISLSAWLSLGGTTAMACWLIAANVIYLKATTGRNYWGITRYSFFEFLHVKWHLMFFVFLFGLYVMARSAYIIIWRTSTARRENVASCIRYEPDVYVESSTPRDVRDNKLAKRVAKEICIAFGIALGALLADYLTTPAVNERFSCTTTSLIVGVVVVAYGVARLAYCGIVRLVGKFFDPTLREQSTTDRYAKADAMIRRTPSTEKPEEAIRIRYSLRRLSEASYHVVGFAIVATVLAAALTQGSLPWGTGLSLIIGGLYPALILLGLSYAVPARPATKLPEWKTWRWLRLLP